MKNTVVKNKVKSYRFVNNWSQEELAEKAGISKSTVYFIETGRNPSPGVGTMRKIAKAFHKKVEEVFDINGEWDDNEWKKIF